jgi:putative transposase
MPWNLKRYQLAGDAHLITFSCHGRNAYIADDQTRTIMEHIFERTRSRHGLRIFAYVLMPEHVHLLVSELPVTPLMTVLRAMKQETSKKLKGDREHFWLPRYHDFNVFTEKKFTEKLKYIHRNPVARGLVSKPEDWPWSSFNHYATGLPGTIEIESWWTEQARTRVRGMTPDAPSPDETHS